MRGFDMDAWLDTYVQEILEKQEYRSGIFTKLFSRLGKKSPE
jgi:hypothetical protein